MQPERVTELMNDPVAVELINSNIPARMAYIALDGTPRVVSMGFHWDGANIVMATLPNSAKVPALRANPKVALTIDDNDAAPNVLHLRGTAKLEDVDGVPDEYLAGARKRVPDEDAYAEFEQYVRSIYKRMVTITVTPEWTNIMDFETRAPKAVVDVATGKVQL